MTHDLKLVQQRFREMEFDAEIYQVLSDCEEMILNGGSRKSVTAYLEMAVHFYGKDRIMAVIENYGLKRLKEYVQN